LETDEKLRWDLSSGFWAKFPCYLLVNPRGQRGKKEKRGKKKGKKRREKEKESNSL
jgi:hypothetical protein